VNLKAEENKMDFSTLSYYESMNRSKSHLRFRKA